MARPSFGPTEEQRRLVKSMAAVGIRQEDIAVVLGLRSVKTLRKHFSKELDCGRIEANGQVAQTLFDLATSGVCVAATIFWAKTRMGFQEIHVVESRPAAIPDFVVAEDVAAQDKEAA
jgi:hypothetical protein